MNSLVARPQLADAEALLEKLKAAAVRDAKKRNLDLLWSVLVDMQQSGVRDFSLSLVGQRLAEAGGPKTQSVRNEGGKDFRDLIAAFVAGLGAHGKARPPVGRSQLDQAIEALPDIGLRALLRQTVAENKVMKSQNDQLRSAFKSLSISTSPAMPQANSVSEPDVIPAAVRPSLSQHDKEILRRSVDPDRFAENGWKARKNGSVVDDSGVAVLPPGFVPLLQRLAE